MERELRGGLSQETFCIRHGQERREMETESSVTPGDAGADAALGGL